MKWPKYLAWLRHAMSAYNNLKILKDRDPDYTAFVAAFEADFLSEETRRLAKIIWDKYSLGVGDHDTDLSDEGHRQSNSVGYGLKETLEPPEFIFVSPHRRTKLTLEGFYQGWPALKDVPVIEEVRLREQEHGLALVYNDWRVFQTFHPEQKMLRDMEGPYYYRYPQGESVPDVIERLRSFIGTLVRDYSERRVMVVSHHLTLLSFMAAVMRWDQHEFIRYDNVAKPINCGLTLFEGDPSVGDNGRLQLSRYNQRLY